MQLMCGEIFSHCFIANYPETVIVKKIENQDTFDKNKDNHKVECFLCAMYRMIRFV